MGFFDLSLQVTAWDRTLRVVVYRKPVHHESRKNYQLDLFDPDDGYFEYSPVTTNMVLSAASVWGFMAGRGAQEKTLGELKRQLQKSQGPAREPSAFSCKVLRPSASSSFISRPDSSGLRAILSCVFPWPNQHES